MISAKGSAAAIRRSARAWCGRSPGACALTPTTARWLSFSCAIILLMTHTAFRRDLEDQKTIFDFARIDGQRQQSQDALSVDLRRCQSGRAGGLESVESVAAGRALRQNAKPFRRSRKGRISAPGCAPALRRVQARVRRELTKEYIRRKVDNFLEAMPERYFLSTPESDILAHFELMERFRGKKGRDIGRATFPNAIARRW